MKCVRKFDGKPYTYVGTYWGREVVRLCLQTGRTAGYLMRQAKASGETPVYPGVGYDLFARKTPKATGPLPVPVVVRGSPSGRGQFDLVSVPGVVLAWTEVQV
ncbi:MAG TPA: hypothetical protein PLP90_04985 [Methanoculleus sp.]|nr:hypothetical protein [Methanoculleus sp.]